MLAPLSVVGVVGVVVVAILLVRKSSKGGARGTRGVDDERNALLFGGGGGGGSGGFSLDGARQFGATQPIGGGEGVFSWGGESLGKDSSAGIHGLLQNMRDADSAAASESPPSAISSSTDAGVNPVNSKPCTQNPAHKTLYKNPKL